MVDEASFVNATHSGVLFCLHVFVYSLERDFAGLKRRRASLLASVKPSSVEVVKVVRSGMSYISTFHPSNDSNK